MLTYKMAAKNQIVIIANDAQFLPELANAGNKLVVVDFFATWCGPCKQIAPVFGKFSNQFINKAIFLKVDVDICQESAAKYQISAMPTFVFIKNKIKIDEIKGADPNALLEKIKQHVGGATEDGDDVGVAGHMDLTPHISLSGSTCLNESDDHTFSNILNKSSAYLESDCDEQLLMLLEFQQPVKLHSFKIKAPSDGKGPKSVKFATNLPSAIDFDQAEGMEGKQIVELTNEDLDGETIKELRYVKFQNVQNVMVCRDYESDDKTIFIPKNQGDEETTVIEQFIFIGSLLDSTNMSEFKRVSGKPGESHF